MLENLFLSREMWMNKILSPNCFTSKGQHVQKLNWKLNTNNLTFFRTHHPIKIKILEKNNRNKAIVAYKKSEKAVMGPILHFFSYDVQIRELGDKKKNEISKRTRK